MNSKEPIELTTEDWARKLSQQAEDSRDYRNKLYNKVDLKSKKKILDVGCGTGAVTFDIARMTTGEVIGIDTDTEKLEKAKAVLKDVQNLRFMEGDASNLPFENETFDLVAFNIVLMHLKKQQRAINEMARVTKKSGYVLATLEPDYASRISYPEDSASKLIVNDIKNRGADLFAGRKLKTLFNSAGLKTQIGMDTNNDFILVNDNEISLKRFSDDFWIFKRLLEKNDWTKEKIEEYKQEKSQLIKDGLTFHFLPCFYAIGKKE